MATVTTESANAVMKRCQIGTTSYDKANDLHAACYGTIGALVQERDQLLIELQEMRRHGRRIDQPTGEDNENHSQESA